jgi:HEAT repeat protein
MMNRSSHDTNTLPTGLEPQLGSAMYPDLSGYEPLLGGVRRAEADMSRVLAIVDAVDPTERAHLLQVVGRLGQTELYARELAQVVPARARVKVGNWRGSFTPGQRQRAMQTLADIGSYESIVPLLEALADDIYEIRKAAEDSLTRICGRLDPAVAQTRVVYQAFVEALRMQPLSARKVVARILAAAPPDLVLGPLLNEGTTSADWWARREAAWVLGALGDRRATLRLIDLLDDSSPAVGASAAWALGQLDAPIAVEPLIDVLDGGDEIVRAAAVEALGALAGRMSLLDDRLDLALDTLIAMLLDGDLAVRHAALDALADLQENPSARRVLKALMDSR